MIFAVLCLTVFALLSISTVQAHEKLSEKSISADESYYRADAAAQEVLAKLRNGEHPENVTREGNIYEYYCIISQTQALMVRVEVVGQNYKILQWQAVSTTDWQAEDRLPVWQG